MTLGENIQYLRKATNITQEELAEKLSVSRQTVSDYKPKRIDWDFPFVSTEQQSRFGLRGYVAAYIFPVDIKNIGISKRKRI